MNKIRIKNKLATESIYVRCFHTIFKLSKRDNSYSEFGTQMPASGFWIFMDFSRKCLVSVFSAFRVADDLHFCSAFSARFHIFYMKPALFLQEGKLSKAGCRHPSFPLCSFFFLLISFLIFIQYFSYSPFLVSSYFHSSP